MKLAEALANRADGQKRLQQVKERLLRSAKVQEGDTPSENPQELLAEMERILAQLTDLVQRINRTNAQTEFRSGASLTDALAERDSLATKRDLLAAVIEASAIRQDRFSRSEVKYLRTVDVAALQKQADDLARQYRELDLQIQELNWKVELSR